MGQFQYFDTRVGFRFIKGLGQDAEGKDFYTEGWATSDDVDFEDDVFDKSAMEAMAQGLLKSPTVFYNHWYEIPVGRVVEAEVRPTERSGHGVWVKVFIDEDAIVPQTGQKIRKLIANGVLSGFSVGGRLLQTAMEFSEELGRKVRRILDFLIYEVSVVGIPCNREARTMDWYVKMYRDVAEQSGGVKDIAHLSEFKAFENEAGSFVTKGSQPPLPETLIEEAATREEAEKMNEKDATPSHIQAKAPRERVWSSTDAKRRLRAKYSSDGSGDKDKMDWPNYWKAAFAYFDENNAESFGAGKLPHADDIDGDTKVVWRAVVAAAAAINGGRGGVDIPEDDLAGVKRHIKRHYQQFEPDEDPFADKSAVELAQFLKGDYETLQFIKAHFSDEEYKELTSVVVVKQLELYGFDVRQFMQNLWVAAIEHAEMSGELGPIDRDYWRPIWLEAVFDGEAVFENMVNEKLYRAKYTTSDGVSFEFTDSTEVVARTIYEEVKSLGEEVEMTGHPMLLGAMPEHQTEISGSEEWSLDNVLDDLKKWASSDGSGDLDTIDWERFSLACAWFGPENDDEKSRYSLIHHQVETIDEEVQLTLNTIGLADSIKAMQDNNAGIPDEDVETVQRHLVAHLRQIDPDAANPFSEPEAVVDGEDVVVDNPVEGDTAASTEPPAVKEVEPEVEPAVEPEAVVEPAVEALVEDIPEDDEAKSTIGPMVEHDVLNSLGKLLNVEPEKLRKLITGMKFVKTTASTIDFDPEAAEQRIRRCCSSDGSGDKETIDWRKYAGFFAQVSGNRQSFASYKSLMFDIVNGEPIAIEAVVQDIADKSKSGEMDLTELDKRRVQAAYQMFSASDPFAMTVEEATRKEVESRLNVVSSSVEAMNKTLEDFMAASKTATDEINVSVEDLKKISDERDGLKDEVKSLQNTLDEMVKRLEIVESASGASQQIPAGEGERETKQKGAWDGLISNKAKQLVK